MMIGPKLWPLECSQCFSMIWPTDLVFDPTWPIFKLDWDTCHDDHSEHVWWWLDQNCGLWSVHKVYSMIWPTDLVFNPTWPIFKLDWDIFTINILSTFMMTGPKMWPLDCSEGFSYDFTYWPSFLTQHQLIFKLDWDIVTMIILSKFDEDWTKTMASIVLTRFLYDLNYWPSFWPDMTHIRNWPRYCQDDHTEHVWWRLDQNCGL